MDRVKTGYVELTWLFLGVLHICLTLQFVVEGGAEIAVARATDRLSALS